MQKTLGLILLAVVILTSGGFLIREIAPETSASASQRVFTFEDFNLAEPLLLNFPQYRVRVDGWDRDYVEIQVDGTATQPIAVKAIGNAFSLQAEQFRPPLWEPAVRVKVPYSTSVHVRGTEIWAKDCAINKLDGRRAYVRDTMLPANLRSKIPWYSDSRDWQTINF
jgi:hypothetical protein